MNRDNHWLSDRLQTLHQQYFADISLENPVLVRFGRITKTRLGSITMRRKKGFSQPVSLITINGLLKDEQVPDYVLDAVLAHEFIHYCHGFHSPRPRSYRYPHQSGIVDDEIKKRGLADYLFREKSWTKKFFPPLYRQYYLTKIR